jgi:hypothetical protein
MLRKKAEKQLDSEINEAVLGFSGAIGRMWNKGYAEQGELLSMALNQLLKEPWVRKHFHGEMAKEEEHGKGRATAISNIHRKLAKEFLDKLDKLGEDVEELRSEVDFHSHN